MRKIKGILPNNQPASLDPSDADFGNGTVSRWTHIVRGTRQSYRFVRINDTQIARGQDIRG